MLVEFIFSQTVWSTLVPLLVWVFFVIGLFFIKLAPDDDTN